MKVTSTYSKKKTSMNKSKNRKKKRKLSCSSLKDCETQQKKPKNHSFGCKYLYESFCNSFPEDSFFGTQHSDRLLLEDKFIWDKLKNIETGSILCEHKEKKVPLVSESKCWINQLPQELILKIFSYLPLGLLLHTIPQICKKWEALALDWTLWKGVEDLTIKNMVISTEKLKTLLRTIPKLKKVELILRNDTEEILQELFQVHKNLEILKLDRCCRSTLQINFLSQTVTSILELCPKLKTVILTDTYFHSKNFYRCLAKKFRTLERVSVTCTSKSEMNVFMENLKESVSEVEFQRVPMMGKAAGKQIYWGPILGLVVRPIPVSPFHQQYIHDNYPNYAF